MTKIFWAAAAAAAVETLAAAAAAGAPRFQRPPSLASQISFDLDCT